MIAVTRRCFAVVLITCSLTAAAQVAVTSLRGSVTDPTGAVIPGAQVTLAQPSTGTHTMRSTNESGEYSFLQVAPGRYSITVTAAGFGTQTVSADLLVSQPATVDFHLTVGGSATQTVEVNAGAEPLNTTDASIGNALESLTVSTLPSEGRNVPDLLSIQPGVVYLGRQVNPDQDSRSGAVDGARSDQSNVTLDGVDDNDQINGYAFTGILRTTIDSVAEFRVITTSADAASGRSSGAQVNIVTKGGSNSLHGGVYEYFRNTYFDANNWFNKQAEISSGDPNKPGTLNRNTYGAMLGGPILKDKLFYFVNYEGQSTAEDQQEVMTVPTASARAGNLQYVTAAGGTYSLSPTQIASMDPHCSAAGTCPWGAGDDPNTLAVFNQYPAPNGTSKGDDLNSASYTFAAPNPIRMNTYILRLDYALNQKMRLFARGNLMGDRTTGVPQFPGSPSSEQIVNNSKGFAVGHIWSLTNNLTNNFRYGYIWEGESTVGAGRSSYVSLNVLSPIVAEDRSDLLNVPVHNILDDVNWTKRNHTFQFGANYRLIHNNSLSDATSYSSASMGVGLLAPASIANASNAQRTVDLDPAAYGFPAVSTAFGNSYDLAAIDTTGVISYVTNNYNYKISKDGLTGDLLTPGSMVARNFKANEFEWYAQDSWRARPNLTVTFGLRYSLLQTPYEVNGQQIQPDIDIHQWFLTRGEQAAQGNSVQPAFSFSPSGQARGGKPFWPMNKDNFAPRLSAAFSPNPRTSIRAGIGVYYDHYGEGIVSSFNKYGAYGVTTTINSPQNVYTIGDAPRFTSMTSIPAVNAPAPATVSYPATPSTDVNGSGFTIAYGIDDHLKTPYSINTDLSVQQQLSRGFTFEMVYIGRLGRHTLQQLDLAQPLDLVDKKSGLDYYGAARLLDQAVDQGATTVMPIAYWEDMFPAAAQNGQSATQNIFQYIFIPERGNEVVVPYFLDVICTVAGLNNPCGGVTGRFWPTQYSSLYSWSTIGTSSYNGGQFMLRHAMSHGFQTDVSYTLSKSLDLGSDAERTSSSGAGTTFSEILDAWHPRKNRGPSDFDVRHLITANWYYQLPFGRGEKYGSGSGKLMNAVISGWRVTGLSRWTSGLPFSVQSTVGWTTNWDFYSNMVQTGPIKIRKHYDANGNPQVFDNPTALQNAIPSGTPWRMPYAGEAGDRNNFRGDGYFDMDSSVLKSWHITERHSVQFAWDMFNIFNSVRFDTNPNTSLDTHSADGSLGIYSSVLSQQRVQQFSLRYSF